MDRKQDTRLINISFGMAWFTILTGVMALIGWAYHIAFLKTLNAHGIVMHPNTAIGFILLATGLLFLRRGSPIYRFIAYSAAIFVLCIGLIECTEYLFYVQIYQDNLFFDFQKNDAHKMPILVAINFILLAMALINLLYSNTKYIAHILLFFSFIIPLLSLLTHIYHIAMPSSSEFYSTLSFQTILSFFLMALGLLLRYPAKGVMTIFTSKGPGGVLVRRLLPFVVFLPILLGYFRLVAEENGFHATPFSGALYIVFIIIAFTPIVTIIAYYLNEKQLVLAKSQHDLTIALSEAQAANQAKNTFLATMSHEIRTPLNGVIGMIELLSDTALTPEQRDYMEIISFSGESLLTVINDILDYSKIESGHFEMESIDFDLRTLIEYSVAMFTPRAHKKGLIMRCLLDENVPQWVNGDPTRIRQVLANLLNNAVKFTEKGHIELRASLQTSENNKLILNIEITDTGIGIPTDKLPRLFHMFSQADNSTSRKYGGSGLGLAIAKRIVEYIGGEIGVNSEANRGSTFWCTIHLTKADLAQPKLEQATNNHQTPIKLNKANLLIAEDNEINQHVIVNLLKKLGFASTTIVNNGAAVFEALKTGSYDLIFMDCEMPQMDGYTASRTLRKLELKHHWKHTPIIAMTAHALKGDRERCLASGMDDYIPKPIDKRELSRVLRQYIATDNGPNEPLIVDKDRLYAIAGDNKEAIEHFLNLFITSATALLEALGQAIQAHNTEQIKQLLHQLKGASGNCGATQMYQLSMRMEDAFLQHDSESITPLYKEILNAFDALKRFTTTTI